jgi:hypothetical protein
MARNEEEFQNKKRQREFPTCPPALEEIPVNGGKRKKFTFFAQTKKLWIPHHAAVFAPTPWTNV